jgi:hypothetical protein
MADDEAGRARRIFLQRGGVAAGLVWSAPVVRSVQLLAAGGTPPPATTTTSTPTAKTYVFSGTGTATAGASAGPCAFNLALSFDANLSTLGQSNLSSLLCLPFGPGNSPILESAFVLVAQGEQISGTLTGQLTIFPITPSQVWAQIVLSLLITDGTGMFAGATGTASFFATFMNPAGDTANLFGTFEVPA